MHTGQLRPYSWWVLVCITTEGQLSVHGSKWLGNLCSRHGQEPEALPGVSCKRLREIARARKDTAGKEGDLSSASLLAQIWRTGEEEDEARPESLFLSKMEKELQRTERLGE